MKQQFKVIGKNDIESTIQCVDCQTTKTVVLEEDVISVLNEFCHCCEKEGVLTVLSY